MRLFSKSDEDLIRQLQHRSPDTRRKAIEQIRERKILQAAMPLAYLVNQDTDADNKVQAAIALRSVGNAEAIDQAVLSLHQQLNSGSDNYARSRFASALGWLSSPLSFNPLATAAEDAWPQVRNGARLALGYMGLPWALGILVRGLGDIDDLARRAAFRALGQLGHPLAFYELAPLLATSDILDLRDVQDAVKYIAIRLGAGNLGFMGTLDRDVDTLSRLVGGPKGLAYATTNAAEWLAARKALIPHLLKDECLSELSSEMVQSSDAYSRRWSREILGSLREHSLSNSLHERAEFIQARMGAVL